MNAIARFHLIATVTFLPALEALAQRAPCDIRNAAVVLPASTPYGEATAIRNIGWSKNEFSHRLSLRPNTLADQTGFGRHLVVFG